MDVDFEVEVVVEVEGQVVGGMELVGDGMALVVAVVQVVDEIEELEIHLRHHFVVPVVVQIVGEANILDVALVAVVVVQVLKQLVSGMELVVGGTAVVPVLQLLVLVLVHQLVDVVDIEVGQNHHLVNNHDNVHVRDDDVHDDQDVDLVLDNCIHGHRLATNARHLR